MNKDEIRECLACKIVLLDKIAINTTDQAHFVAERRMSSLGRLLRDRAALIERLAEIDAKLRSEPGWNSSRLFAADVQAIEEKQQSLMAACRRVLNQALAEQQRIGAEIGNSRIMRKAKANYVHKWTLATFRNRINVKG